MRKLVALLGMICLVSAAANANVVTNGGFESGVGVAATGWTQNEFAPGTTLQRVAELPNSGDYSMKYVIN